MARGHKIGKVAELNVRDRGGSDGERERETEMDKVGEPWLEQDLAAFMPPLTALLHYHIRPKSLYFTTPPHYLYYYC